MSQSAEKRAEPTPEPWRGCKDGECQCGYIFGEQGKVYVAQVFGPENVDNLGGPDPRPNRETQKANIRLIVAKRDTAIERERLETDLEKTADYAARLLAVGVDLAAERDRFLAANAELATALKFYATPKSYVDEYDMESIPAIFSDNGQRARAALKAHGPAKESTP